MSAEIDAAIVPYFAGEKRGARAFAAVGLAAVVAGGLLWTSATPWRAMAVPLAGVGIVQLAVGTIVHRRTDRQVEGLRSRLAAEGARARAAEIDRMRRVMSSFRVYKAIEIALLTAGLTLAFLFPRNHPLYAAGIGCLLQGSATLVLDRLAERRAHDYLVALSRPA